MRVGKNTYQIASVRTERVRCGEPQPLKQAPSTEWGGGPFYAFISSQNSTCSIFATCSAAST